MLVPPNKPHEVPTTVNRRKRVILSVDDEPGLLYSRQEILKAEGYDVLSASNGEQAMAIVDSAPVDLVILDYRMPGYDGSVVARAIKARQPRLPIIMVSAFPVEYETSPWVDTFLAKGEGPAALLEKIKQLLNPVSHPESPEATRLTNDVKEKSELWMELAELASHEEDPEKLMALVSEIDRLLEKGIGSAKKV